MAKSIALSSTLSFPIYRFTVTKTGNSDTLNGNITSSVTTVSLNDASTFATSGTIRIGEELITYTGKSGNDLTGCVRGKYYISASAHTNGDAVHEVTIVLPSVYGNLQNSTTFDYFTDTADVGSCIYFCGYYFYSSGITGVFFHIGTAFSATSYELVLEAFDRRGGFTELPNQTDNTNQLSTTGDNWWLFNEPWWQGSSSFPDIGITNTMILRLRIKSVSGLTEGGANQTTKITMRNDAISISGGTSGDPVTMTNIYDAMISAGWTDVVERSPTSGKDDLIYTGQYFFINGFKISLSGGCVFSSTLELILFRTGHFDGDNNTSNVVKLNKSVLFVGGFGYNMNLYWSGAYKYEMTDSCVFNSGAQLVNYSSNFIFTKSILISAGDDNFYGGYTQKWDRSVTHCCPNTYTAPNVRDWTFEGSNISSVSAYQDTTGLLLRDASFGGISCNSATKNILYDVNGSVSFYGYQYVGSADTNIYIHFSLSILVQDEGGNPIQGAIVSFTDKNGNVVKQWVGTVTSGSLNNLNPITTNVNGQTGSQDLLVDHHLLTHPGPASYSLTRTIFSPIVFTVRATGFEAYASELAMTKKTELTIVLKRQIISIDQELQL